MKNIDVSFIENTILRENIKNVSVDINALTMMTPFADREVQDCLRKTIIIYTASVIEALLLWKIKKEFGTGKITLQDEWKQQILYTLPSQKDDEECKITLIKQIKEKKDIDKLDFNRMINLCKNKKILKEGLLENVEEVRKLRNKLYIGGLKTVTKTYPQKDVEFTLEILKETTQSIK